MGQQRVGIREIKWLEAHEECWNQGERLEVRQSANKLAVEPPSPPATFSSGLSGRASVAVRPYRVQDPKPETPTQPALPGALPVHEGPQVGVLGF